MIFLLITTVAAQYCASVGGYWESWNMFRPNDYGSILSNITTNGGITDTGFNFVLIAFASYDFSCGGYDFGFINQQTKFGGDRFTSDDLKASISAVHNAGAAVFLTFGGATFTYSGYIDDDDDVCKFTTQLLKRIDYYHIDVIDFSQVIQDDASIMIKIIKKLNSERPSLHIMYTIPANGAKFSPWKDVLLAVASLLQYVQITVYDYYNVNYSALTDFTSVHDLGVNWSQMIYGVMPGQNDHQDEYTTLTDATQVGVFIADNHLFPGAIIWSINRDTDHRTAPLNTPLYETGQPDGTYAKTIRDSLLIYNSDCNN